MKIDLGAAFNVAWQLFKRDREVLLTLGGAFLFLPTLAVMLLVDPAPPMPASEAGQEAVAQWVQSYVAWTTANAPLMLFGSAAALFGSLAITALYVDPSRPDVGRALGIALRRLPGFLLLMVGVTLVASIGFVLFVLPGLWLLGRTLLVAPAMIAEDISPVPALSRSIALTRGSSLALAGLAGIALFGGQLLASPLLTLDAAMRQANAANPVAVTLVDMGAAAIAAGVALAMVLIRVTIYWRATAPSSGI